jgi:hypothetical protein
MAPRALALPRWPAKIISGGQTGADIGGLVGARRVGIATGGTAPRGYRTDAGPQPVILKQFGLVEHPSSSYRPRTTANVLDSDATVLFGQLDSPGCTLTLKLCKQYRRPKLENPSAAELRRWVTVNQIATLNVAGNRERLNPGIARRVARIIATAFRTEPAT